jgi:hypothetical protein
MKDLMKYYKLRHIFLCAVCWVAGLAIAFLIQLGPAAGNSGVDSNQALGLSLSDHPLLNIWSNNLLYAVALLVLGFFSGGIYALATFIYNGFLLGLYIKKAMAMSVGKDKILHLLVYHSPLEVGAFLLLGALSFQGIYFYKKLLSGTITLPQEHLPARRAVLIPFALIMFAGIIEYLVILKFT